MKTALFCQGIVAVCSRRQAGRRSFWSPRGFLGLGIIVRRLRPRPPRTPLLSLSALRQARAVHRLSIDRRDAQDPSLYGAADQL